MLIETERGQVQYIVKREEESRINVNKNHCCTFIVSRLHCMSEIIF